MISAVVAAAFVLSIAVIAKGARMGLASFEYLGRGIHEELLRWRARRARPGRTVLLGRVVADPEGLVERRVVFERHGLRCRWTRYLYFRIGWWRRTSDTVSVAPFWL